MTDETMVGLTKKERRELRRQQTPVSSSLNSWILWGGVLAAVVGLMVWLVTAGTGSSPSSDEPLVGQEVASDEWIKGPVDAPITLIEYSDFQCPACLANYPRVKQLAETYPDRLRIVYRHFPLSQIHDHAQLAARAAEAAGIQGKFWQMHDLLFESQNQWGTTTPGQLPEDEVRQFILELAEQLELDLDQFQADWGSEATAAAVAADYRAGQQARVAGTPTFILNGRKIDNGDLREAVDQAIASLEP